MIVLTDCPAAAADLLGAPIEWRGAGTAADVRLLGDLDSGPDRWRGELDAGSCDGLAFWGTLVVVADAPVSQYDRLRGILGGRPPAAPVATVALSGRGFHGHRGRPWRTEPGNLHLCAALPARLPAAAVGVAPTMLPVVAVADAVRVASGGRVAAGIKWVNDLLVDGRKVAGALTACHAQAGLVELVVLGIGVNVERVPAVPADPFVPAVGRLSGAAAGWRPRPGEILRALLATLSIRFRELEREGPGPLLEAYRERSLVVGRAVRVWDEDVDGRSDPRRWPAPLARGVVREIAPDLGLLLDGHPVAVTRGRLALEETCLRLGI